MLIHPEINAERDDHSLQQYLSMQFCLEDKTLFDGIKKIEPGHFLIGRGASILKNKCFWEANYHIDSHHKESYFNDQLLALLQESVRLQIRSDVPLGGYLSGGIDSSPSLQTCIRALR